MLGPGTAPKGLAGPARPAALRAPSAAARAPPAAQQQRRRGLSPAAAVPEWLLTGGCPFQQRRPASGTGVTSVTRAAGAGAGAGSPPSSSPSSPPQQQQQQRPAPVDLSGLYVKDQRRSDLAAYERSLDLLGLSGLQRVAARLIDGLEIKQDATTLSVSFVTEHPLLQSVPFFKVTERVPIDGAAPAQLPRRDLRSGKQSAAAARVEGGVRVEMAWGMPLAGSLVEEYKRLPDGSLSVTATTKIGPSSVTAVTVYRPSRSREEIKQQRQREWR